MFADRDCCCEPVLNLDEAMADEQVQARRMVVEMVHQSWGAYRQLGIAPKFSLTPGAINSHAPELGEHTNEILKSYGYSAEDIDRLKAGGVV